MKNNIFLLIAASIFILSFSSCDDLLDVTPKDKITPETFFSTEADLQAFSTNFYNSLPKDRDLYKDDADNITHSTPNSAATDSRTVPASGGGWEWGYLRRFNTLLQYSVNCKDKTVRTRYQALTRFFRAYFYFEMVKRFGDVPWYDTELFVSETDQLNKPRDSRELVMKKILEDLDFAITNLSTTPSVYTVTKWTALSLKSRICLFEGTFRKYHNLNLSTNADFFLQESITALYTEGGTNQAYRKLFTSQNAPTTEVIMARNYNLTYDIYNTVGTYHTSVGEGRPGVTRKIIASYLMNDGSRFTDNPNWETMTFVDECKNRDPRLAQSICTPSYQPIVSNRKNIPDLNACVTGYQLIKYEDEAVGGKSDIDLFYFRLAEVYLNYAEALAEINQLTQDDLDISINKLRDRVGMPHLIMKTANANPDPYLLANTTGYPNVSGANQGVILEIRRERTIELLSEHFRYDDILRWKAGQNMKQAILGMYFPSPGEYDLNGDGQNDICLYTDTKPGNAQGITYLKIDSDIKLSDGNKGYLSPHKGLTLFWNEQRDYFYPIPSNERLITNGALTQNPGWDDGLNF
jgi:hypothetical protein